MSALVKYGKQLKLSAYPSMFKDHRTHEQVIKDGCTQKWGKIPLRVCAFDTRDVNEGDSVIEKRTLIETFLETKYDEVYMYYLRTESHPYHVLYVIPKKNGEVRVGEKVCDLD
jgi:hypothetical protein